MSERVALLGGTFDPIHCGHIRVFRQVMETGGFDQGWLLVAGDPQLRGPVVADVAARLEMARAAAFAEGWQVCDLETAHAGPTYTLETLRRLRELHPAVDFSFVAGADAARQIQRWHRWQELVRTTRFLITNRANIPEISSEEAAELGFIDAQIIAVDSPPISATAIRKNVASGESLAGLVPDRVADIIARRGLYAETPGTHGIMAENDV